jgi:hypothetical protein
MLVADGIGGTGPGALVSALRQHLAPALHYGR